MVYEMDDRCLSCGGELNFYDESEGGTVGVDERPCGMLACSACEFVIEAKLTPEGIDILVDGVLVGGESRGHDLDLPAQPRRPGGRVPQAAR